MHVSNDHGNNSIKLVVNINTGLLVAPCEVLWSTHFLLYALIFLSELNGRGPATV